MCNIILFSSLHNQIGVIRTVVTIKVVRKRHKSILLGDARVNIKPKTIG